MARIQPTPGTDGATGPDGDGTGTGRRRKAVRYAVPVAVAGVAAATIGITSAFAGTGDPDLPRISAQDLIAKMAQSDTQRMSGTVKISTDLGLPSLPSGASFGADGKDGKGGKGGGHDGGKGGAAPSPESKLTELLSGTHTLRVAADGPDKQRLSLVERAAEYSVIRNGDQLWAYDSASNTVYHSKAPKAPAEGKGGKAGQDMPKGLGAASPQELSKKVLAAADESTSITVDGTAKVAGRDAYQLVIKPKQGESTVGSVRIAVDAKSGVPLKFTLAAKSGGKAVVDAGFTKVDFGKPSAGTFAFTPPKGAKVTEADEKAAGAGRDHKNDHKSGLPEALGLPGVGGDASVAPEVTGEGWASIARFSAGKDAGTAVTGKAKSGAKGGEKNAADAGALLDSFGTKVSGGFGSGRVFSTKIVNALVTDDGKVYVGAVDKDALVKAANAAK
ncbi:MULTISPECIES: LolA family protein [Streptomyces]|uniref:Outer membrane lipoprotein carrier protein LolA n=1 Tax=Streptomyces griseocarneus TaxID=51201 RepID=A0ABX7RFR5_9ACTN|nr:MULTISPECIES: sigma-E factor regulatory protein RseB domain-containing protein [Streptomyces]QSY47030.1 outer membrane lipoprotein carrier protein LolA [Streptomyces griseocarneus]